MDLKTTIDSRTTVSTVRLPDPYRGWAWIDRGAERPELGYETLVFRDSIGDDSTMQRYATEDAARAGHEAAVTRERSR